MSISVLGGVYHESCFKPGHNEIYGSGLRATVALSSILPNIEFLSIYNTTCNIGKQISICSTISEFTCNQIHNADEEIFFKYLHPLAVPFCSFSEKHIPTIEYNTRLDSLLKYGILELNVKTISKRVVYDPQNPTNPTLFDSDGSIADEIVYILNKGEAVKLTGEDSPSKCAASLLKNSNVICCIIKCDSEGAFVATSQESKWIPVYQTDKIWLIGSGDIFSATFAYYWFHHNFDFFTCAEKASFFTAYYSNFQILDFSSLESNLLDFNPIPLVSNKPISSYQIYLAGPFFNLQQYDYIIAIRDLLKRKNLKIFSPFHEVGTGRPQVVAKKDLAAIDSSQILFALLDDLDPGTIFEIGYARSHNIPVIICSDCLSEQNSTMFLGSDCEIYNDLSTAVYKLIWKLHSL